MNAAVKENILLGLCIAACANTMIILSNIQRDVELFFRSDNRNLGNV